MTEQLSSTVELLEMRPCSAHYADNGSHQMLGTGYVRPNQMQLFRADASPACSTRSLTCGGGSSPSMSARCHLQAQ